MIALVEGAERQKTPNEIALTILLTTLTIIFLVTVMAQPLAVYSGEAQSVVILVALLVCLIPTTIGALLSAIGIAGMDRLVQRNVLAMSGRAVEAAGDVSTLLLDKTGTITLGNRQASEFIGIDGAGAGPPGRHTSSLADSTPEGKSIVDLATYGVDGSRTAEALAVEGAKFIEFSATTRMSAWTCPTARGPQGRVLISRGARDRRRGACAGPAGRRPHRRSRRHAAGRRRPGGRATARVLGVVHLKDIVKPGMRERWPCTAHEIRTVMITGDNPLTAAAIAARPAWTTTSPRPRPRRRCA